MKKSFLLTLACASMSLGLTGCGRYSAHYNAFLLAENRTSKNSAMTFQSLTGTYVFNMKFGADNTKLTYSGKIESGTVNVFYDNTGEKKELFTVNAGEEVKDSFTELQEGSLYIIIETVDECKAGEFHFVIS